MFHSTSDDETEFIKLRFGRHVRVAQIPNYIELPPLVERAAENYLLFIGRIHRKKGIDILLNALALSKEFRRSGRTLKIAGTGDDGYTNKMKQIAQDLEIDDRVEFIGQVEGEAKERLYANAYWTFMPSHSENFGLVVVESLAQNTPAVASTGAPWKILEDEKVGFWIENSPQSLADTIDKVLTMSPAEYEGYRSRSRAFVERAFDIDKNIGRWTDFYNSLVNE